MSTALTPNLPDSLDFIELAAAVAPARSLMLSAGAAPPVVVYTDCSDEGGHARVGALILPPQGRPLTLVYDEPDQIRGEWGVVRSS